MASGRPSYFSAARYNTVCSGTRAERRGFLYCPRLRERLGDFGTRSRGWSWRLGLEPDRQTQGIDRHVEGFLPSVFKYATGTKGAVGAKTIADNPSVFQARKRRSGQNRFGCRCQNRNAIPRCSDRLSRNFVASCRRLRGCTCRRCMLRGPRQD